MRFLIDESADARVAVHLRSLGHDATTVAGDHRPGLSDAEVLAIAHSEGRILITDDADFGGLVIRHRYSHAGVIYFRLATTALAVRLARLEYVLQEHEAELNRFIVVTESSVRIAQNANQLRVEEI